MTSRPLFLAAIVSSTVLLALTGCGKTASESAAEMAVAAATGGKVQVSKSGSQTTIKTDQGVVTASSGGNLAVPKDFPSDVHLPSGSYTVNNIVQAGPMTIVTVHSPAPVSALYAEYDAAMKSSGWKQTMAIQSSESGAMLSFEKDARTITVTLASQDGGTNVSLQHSVQKPGG